MPKTAVVKAARNSAGTKASTASPQDKDEQNSASSTSGSASSPHDTPKSVSVKRKKHSGDKLDVKSGKVTSSTHSASDKASSGGDKPALSAKPKIKRTWDKTMADADALLSKSEPSKRKWRRRDDETNSEEQSLDIDSIPLPPFPGATSKDIPSIPLPSLPVVSNDVPTTVHKPSVNNVCQISSLTPAVAYTTSSAERPRSKHPRITFESSPDRSKIDQYEARETSSERFTFFFTKKYVFSNHYPCSFKLDGNQYNCSEQYYMFMKAKLFNDNTVADAIMSYSNPKDMKNVAGAIKGFDQREWDDVSEAIMTSANWEKYTQDRYCRLALLETEGTTLVECSPNDKKWGIGLDMLNPDRYHRGMWRGENLLGRILTRIREEIIKKPEYAADLEEARRRIKYNRRRTY